MKRIGELAPDSKKAGCEDVQTEPERTTVLARFATRSAVLWTGGILLFLGAAWFVGAIVVPVRRTQLAVNRCFDGPDSLVPGEIERLGGAAAARKKLLLYLRWPRSLAAHRSTAVFMLGKCDEPPFSALVGFLKDEDEEVRWVCWDGSAVLGQSTRS